MTERAYWVRILERLAEPILTNLAAGKLKEQMPVVCGQQRELYAHLEAFARLLTGIAPWLALPVTNCSEGRLRKEYQKLVLASLDAATDPQSPDYMNFIEGGQPLVDTAFLAHGILRAPQVLWEPLDARVKQNIISALKSTRRIRPVFSNWLLFSAMIETALHFMGEEFDPMRVDYAIRQHEQWYVGDGLYSDGPVYHWDYYNSFVIHPLLLDIIEYFAKVRSDWREFVEPVTKRAQRYAVILERLISPEGTFPPIGRSLAYRFGAFHLLAQLALKHQLPEELTPAQVRCALTAVIKRTMEVPATFDDQGWLTVGLCGFQPSIGEFYISTGSLYLCAAGLLPLGLAATDPFWADPSQNWTAKKLWSGKDLKADQAL